MDIDRKPIDSFEHSDNLNMILKVTSYTILTNQSEHTHML